MKYICSLVLFLCFTLAVNSQGIKFPLKNGVIHYQDSVKVKTSKDTLIARVGKWITDKKDFYQLEQEKTKSDTIVRFTGKMRVDPDSGNYRAVDCTFKMKIQLHDSSYKYDLTDLEFIKEKKKYNVTEVYQGIINDDPAVKQFFEAKHLAVQRHEFYLRLLITKVKLMNESLHQTAANITPKAPVNKAKLTPHKN